MGLEMVADDDDGCAGLEGGVHSFRRTDSSADDEGDRDIGFDGADDVRRDGMYGSRTSFEIDVLLTHHLGGNTGVNDGLQVGWLEGFGARDAHGGSDHSTIYEDVGSWDEINVGITNNTRRFNLLTYKVLRVWSARCITWWK